MRQLICVLVLGLAAAEAATAEARPELGGRWATEGFGSIVEFRPRTAVANEMCGRLVWLAPGPGRRLRTARRKPDAALRVRPLVGIEIVRGLRQTAPDVWSGGRFYNPDDGRTYSGTLRLANGRLELEGCTPTVVCRTQTSRRPQDLLAAAQVR